MKKKLLSMVLMLAMVTIVLVGCGSDGDDAATEAPDTTEEAGEDETEAGEAGEDETEAEEVGDITVGFIVGSKEHVFYNLIEDAIIEKAAELGIEAIVYDGELDANIQSNHIENLIAMEVDAIALATVDAAGVGPAISSAEAAGIPTFTFDSPSDNDVITHVGTDNVEGGRLGAQETLRLVESGDTVAMIGNPASSSVLDRQKGFEEVMEAQDEVEYAFFGNYEGDANVAQSLMQDWLTADPDLAAVFCAGDPAATGALSAIKAAGADTKVIGFDGNPEAIDAIFDQEGDGKWWVSEISQNPTLIGHTITEQIYQYLTKGTVDAELIPIDPYIITYDYIVENELR